MDLLISKAKTNLSCKSVLKCANVMLCLICVSRDGGKESVSTGYPVYI